MLNSKTNIRELAYVVNIDAIEPILGSDNCECAIIGGWHVMVRKNEFKAGDLAVYFEIDSYLDPSNPAFSFMEKKKYKVKTQRYTFGGKGNFISQGLLMSAANFGWTIGHVMDENNTPFIIENDQKTIHHINDESRFLTEKLGITYAVPDDNVRKAASADKYKKMAQRHGKLFSKQPFRWLMKRDWGKKVLFLFFGRARDKKNSWPAWVSKTDEERVQNIPWILNDKSPWIATEKIDGTSTTFTMKRHKGIFGTQYEFFVCSRNVVFDKPDKKCFYETNVYTEMAEKYHMENVLKRLLNEVFTDAEWITIQGETFGAGVQKRDYSLEGHDFRAFNLIVSNKGRIGSIEAEKIVNPYGIKWVPILETLFILPDTVDELLTIATGKSVIDGKSREGIVFRSPDGVKSFKAVSNDFLLEFHQ